MSADDPALFGSSVVSFLFSAVELEGPAAANSSIFDDPASGIPVWTIGVAEELWSVDELVEATTSAMASTEPDDKPGAKIKIQLN